MFMEVRGGYVVGVAKTRDLRMHRAAMLANSQWESTRSNMPSRPLMINNEEPERYTHRSQITEQLFAETVPTRAPPGSRHKSGHQVTTRLGRLSAPSEQSMH